MRTRFGGSGHLSLAAALLAAALLGGCEGDRGAQGLAGMDGADGAAGTPGADAGALPPAACTPVATLPAGLPASALALTASGKLVRFTPGSSAGGNSLVVLGLGATESLVGIDFRPADGALIGVIRNGTAGSLVRIDSGTGETRRLTPVGATALTLAGTQYGVDFNPVSGALRIVGDNEENYRLTFSGANLLNYTVLVDTALNPAGTVIAAAYTNNFTGTPQTTLYEIDSSTDSLLTQGGVDGATNPNAGGLATVGSLGGIDVQDVGDLDVDGVTGVALAVLNLAGAVSTGVYGIDLGTGAASCIGTVPALSGDLAVDLAIPTPGPAIAYGLTTGNGIVTFTPNAAGVGTATGPVAITGLASGTEVIVGMDLRPRTGALVLVTRDPSDAIVNLGRLYQVDPITGVAALIAANSTALDFDDAATALGVDFNPVPNALRIVNDAEQNFRLTFPAGTAGYGVTADLAVNPAGTASAAAYTNNFDGATATRLYIIDTASNELKFQNPPNDGTQAVVGTLGVSAANHDSGFDIVGGAGVTGAGVNIGNTVAFAALTVGASSNLYRINLQTGAATQVGSGPIGGSSPQALKGLAVLVRK
ncbi:MAG: DUF4394 domain-containing protein [Nevskiaceae bacterium]